MPSNDMGRCRKSFQVLFKLSTIPSSSKMPSHYIRPVRRAAQLAAIRINEIANADNSDSDESAPIPTSVALNDSGIIRARNNGYDDTVFVVRYLLGQSDAAKCSEDRLQIAENMFDVLNKNPSILIYEPKFRTAVIKKMSEFNDTITKRLDGFNKAEYKKAINIMKLSMKVHITNSKMRAKIYDHLDSINNELSVYNNWLKSSTLKTNFYTLNKTLESIKTHPNYVV